MPAFDTKNSPIITPINVREYYDIKKTEKENIEIITNLLRDKVIELGNKL